MTRTPKWPTKRPKTCRQMLVALDGWLSINDDEQHYFWSVITATRGPDQKTANPNAFCVKLATTGLIRVTAFPRAVIGGGLGDSIVADTNEHLATRLALEPAHSHFCNHARSAFDALGLSWERVNPPIKEKK